MSSLIGIGLYTYQEAARYSGLNIKNVYNFVNNKVANPRSTLWTSEIGKLGERNYLSFRDLAELRAIETLKKRGFSWQKIREAAEYIKDQFHDNYPLSNGKIRTTDVKIFYDGKDLTSVIGKSQGNYSLREVLNPLLHEIEYNSKNEPVRWYPYLKSRSIVLDPEYSQGKPILKEYHIPTDIVADAYKIEKNYELVSRLYDVPITAIKTAIDFENKLAA